MGLSFHYSGRFNPSASLQDLIDEVEDVARIHDWKYFIFEKSFPKNSIGLKAYNDKLYGICFSPPECEPVWLSFLSNGRMCSADSFQFYAHSTGKQEQQYLYMLSTKTQFAGMQVHMIVIQLLKYLSKKYLLDFKVSDEGQYWETGDEIVLKNIFKTYTDLLDGFSTLLETFPADKNESIENYIERMMAYFIKRRSRKE